MKKKNVFPVFCRKGHKYMIYNKQIIIFEARFHKVLLLESVENGWKSTRASTFEIFYVYITYIFTIYTESQNSRFRWNNYTIIFFPRRNLINYDTSRWFRSRYVCIADPTIIYWYSSFRSSNCEQVWDSVIVFTSAAAILHRTNRNRDRAGSKSARNFIYRLKLFKY